MKDSMGIGDLPLGLRELILSKLNYHFPSRSPPVRTTLRHRKHLYHRMPHELLAPALSAPVISIAVASILGPRARFLTRQVAKTRLADWAHALLPHVQAVSFYDDSLVNYAGVDLSIARDHAGMLLQVALLREGIAVLEAVSEPPVALRVIDLVCVPVFRNEHLKETFYGALVTALRHNAASLRELALPVSDVCARALDKVHLPALEVALFEFSEPNYVESELSEKPWLCDMARMLRALQKSGGGGKGVRDLRLENLVRAPLLDGLSLEFLHGVKTLEVDCGLADAFDMTSVVHLFPELRCVHWNMTLIRADVERLVAACPLLEEIHNGAKPLYRDDPDDFYDIVDELARTFQATGGKLRYTSLIEMNGNIPSDLINALGVSSPHLEKLDVSLSRSNASALVPLLTTQCRKLQSLCLFCEVDAPGTAGWKCLTAAVCGASDTLREVEVLGNVGHDMNFFDGFTNEHDVQGLVVGMCKMLEKLGDRGLKVSFKLDTRVEEFRIIFGALRHVVEAATKYCENIEWFEVSLGVGLDCIWNNEEEINREFYGLLEAVEMLRTSARRLHFLALDNTDKQEWRPH